MNKATRNTITLFLVSALCIIYFVLMQNTGVVFTQVFIERNPDLSYPKGNQQVSNTMLWCLSVLIPFSYLLYFFSPAKVLDGKIKYTILWISMGIFINVLLTSAITNSLKVLFGEPRPSFFAICNYQHYNDAILSNNFTTYNNITTAGAFGNISNCYADHSDIRDAFASFPSGHSSLIFSSMTYLSSILMFFSKIYKKYYVFIVNVIVVFGSYIIACWVAITRVQDYKHRTYDIFAGAFLGICVASLVWKCMYTEIRRFLKPNVVLPVNRGKISIRLV